MKKIKVILLGVILVGVTLSCEKNTSFEPEPDVSEDISETHIKALHKAGVNPSNAFYDTIKRLDGSINKVIRVGDIVLRVDKLDKYALSDGKSISKKYGSNNLIHESNRVINVIGYTGVGLGLTSRMQTGLRWAVHNYNRLNTSLQFKLLFSSNHDVFNSHNDTNGDIIFFKGNNSDIGGMAEFPFSGIPGRFVQLFAGNQELSNNMNEHIITHQLGHAIGLRHTDYLFRACDSDTNDKTIDVIETINIPGIQSINQKEKYDIYGASSLMISCFKGTEDGEFSDVDIAILKYLY